MITNTAIYKHLTSLLFALVCGMFINTQALAITISGTCKQADNITDCTDTGTIRFTTNVNGGVLYAEKQDIVAGTWSISGIPAFPTVPDLIVTLFIDGATDAQEAVAVFRYSGTGDTTGVELIESHLTIGSDHNSGLSNHDLRFYDHSASGDEDIFYDVDDITNVLTVDVTGNTPNNTFYIKSNNPYTPGPNTGINAHHVEINGTLGLGSNTMNVSGDWEMTNGVFNRDTSTVNFTGTGTISNDVYNWWNKAFYNVSAAAAGHTTTILAGRGTVVKNTLTLGTGTLAGGSMVLNKAGTPLITAGTTISSPIKYSPPPGAVVNITGTNYARLWLAENSSANDSTFNLLGDLSCTTLISQP